MKVKAGAGKKVYGESAQAAYQDCGGAIADNEVVPQKDAALQSKLPAGDVTGVSFVL